MRAVLRFLFVVPIGFIAACMTGSFAMLWPFIELPAGEPARDPVFLIQAGVAFFAQAAQIGSVTLMPWAAFMVLTEVFALSSILLHLLAGVGGAVAIIVTAYGTNIPHLSVQTAIVVASISFSLVYWIVAGHAAGKWRRNPQVAANVDGSAENKD